MEMGLKPADAALKPNVCSAGFCKGHLTPACGVSVRVYIFGGLGLAPRACAITPPFFGEGYSRLQAGGEPGTGRAAPVISRAAGDARKRITSASDSGCTQRVKSASGIA